MQSFAPGTKRLVCATVLAVAAACRAGLSAEASGAGGAMFAGSKWVDMTHSNVGHRIQQTAIWLDTRFGDSSITTDRTAACTAMLGVEAVLEDADEFTFRARGRATFDLPRMENRLRLFVDNFRHDMLPGLDPIETGERFKIGTAWQFYRDLRSLLDLDAGVRPRFPPEPFVTLRYKYEVEVGDWMMGLVQKGFWTVDDHLGELTALTLMRQIREGCLFRSVTAGKFAQESEGLESEQTLAVAVQFAAGRRQLEFSGSIFLNRNDIVNYRLRAGWRARWLRDWNTVYIVPELQFPDEHDFHCRPGVRVGIETAYW
jgi:hypothetical protein